MTTLTKEEVKEVLDRILPNKRYREGSWDSEDATRDACIDEIIKNAIECGYLDPEPKTNSVSLDK